jgi:hypothetical protein
MRLSQAQHDCEQAVDASLQSCAKSPATDCYDFELCLGRGTLVRLQCKFPFQQDPLHSVRTGVFHLDELFPLRSDAICVLAFV